MSWGIMQVNTLFGAHWAPLKGLVWLCVRPQLHRNKVFAEWTDAKALGNIIPRKIPVICIQIKKNNAF